MLTGFVDEARRQYVSGWAFDRDHPDQKVEVVISVNGEERARVTADQLRPDLKALEYGDGCHGFVYRFNTPLSVIRTYEIVVRFAAGTVVNPGKITLAKDAIEPHRELRPVLLTATGRSGTSLMMRRLGADPSIVVAGHFPYEIKLLTYYARAFEVLTATGNHERSVDPNLIFDDPFHLGLNPFNHHFFAHTFPKPNMIHDFFERQAAPTIAGAFRSIVSQFYDCVRSSQSKDRAGLFAEKCDLFNPTRDFVRSAYASVREIILVRDLRDVFCSYRSFWSTPVEEAMQILRSVRDKMLQFRQETSHDRIFIRYEDLMLRPDVVLTRVSGFLGLDHVISVDPEAEQAHLRVHATSGSGPSSVGRWQSELGEAELQSFASDFTEFFEAFGYNQLTNRGTNAPQQHDGR